MGKRTAAGIIAERSKRLLIPLVFGMLVIVPPQIYYERISNGIQFANYFEFWKTVFEFIPYPKGGSLSWHHLWHVLYIFVYSILALPIFLFLKSSKSNLIKEKINYFFNNHTNAIYRVYGSSLREMISHRELYENKDNRRIFHQHLRLREPSLFPLIL